MLLVCFQNLCKGPATFILQLWKEYLKGTVPLGIWFRPLEQGSMLGFVDSDWTVNIDDMKSTIGYVSSLGSGVISWIRRSKKWCCNPLQRLSMETSTMANQTIWLRRNFQGSWELQLELRSSVITSQQLLLQKIQCRLQHGQTMYIPGRFQAIR